MKKFTTMAMGGPARFFVAVASEKELLDALGYAKRAKMPWYVVGAGSNLIVADKGYDGLVIANRIEKFQRAGNAVKIGAGNELLSTIWKFNGLGLKGLEKMAGIPGTVGGAIYGAAGAYGRELQDVLRRVRFYDGRRFRSLSRKQCRFGYRTSIFKKHKDWIITEAELTLEKGERGELQKISKATIRLREKKYRPGLRCPGSFFKNIKLSDLGRGKQVQSFLKKVNPEKIRHGKLPVGYLLEEVNAKGLRVGTVGVAKHHGNLIYNPGQGLAGDVRRLAKRLKSLVKKKFHVTIEEEVQYLGFENENFD